MRKLLTTTFLCGILLTPGYLMAQDHDRRDDHHDARHDRGKRYYDKSHKDYHDWNSDEDRAWHRYWQDRHHSVVDWNRASETQRNDYWRWRHDHPDSVLFQVRIR